jgi:hypothetical protein
VAQLSSARVRLLVQSDSGSPVTDDMDRFIAPSQLHVVGQLGDAAAGLRARVSLDDGVTILGGFSIGEQHYQRVRADDDTTLAFALRYAPPHAVSRPFVEVGGLVGRDGAADFSRTYANGAGTATGRGIANWAESAIWGRLGWVWDPDAADQVGAYVEYTRLRQSIDGYLEPLSNLDPFEAAVGRGVDRMDVGRLGVRFDHEFSSGWEAFGGFAVAHAFSHGQSLAVTVDGFGAVAAPAIGQLAWIDYRARLGRHLTRRSTLSVYVGGVAGTAPLGASVDGGLDYRITF